MSTLLELEQVGKTYADGTFQRTLLRSVALSVGAGEIVTFVGPSGCGKTTLLTLMSGLDIRFDGDVRFLGRSFKSMSEDERTMIRNERFSFVFQAFHLLEHLTVGQNVLVPLWLRRVPLSRDEELRRLQAALSHVGLADRAEEPVRRLSGGERQRVAIARALVTEPLVLFADEPTGNLDEGTAQKVAELFRKMQRGEFGSPCTVVIATHDPRLTRSSDRVFQLQDGALIEERR